MGTEAKAKPSHADITVPAAYIEGLPIGITFIGGRWGEPDLLGLASDFEQCGDDEARPFGRASC